MAPLPPPNNNLTIRKTNNKIKQNADIILHILISGSVSTNQIKVSQIKQFQKRKQDFGAGAGPFWPNWSLSCDFATAPAPDQALKIAF